LNRGFLFSVKALGPSTASSMPKRFCSIASAKASLPTEADRSLCRGFFQIPDTAWAEVTHSFGPFASFVHKPGLRAHGQVRGCGALLPAGEAVRAARHRAFAPDAVRVGDAGGRGERRKPSPACGCFEEAHRTSRSWSTATTRAGQVAADYLGEYRGLVQTDGYGGYDLLDRGSGIVHAGCWAHVRRKFHVVQTVPRPRPGPLHPRPAAPIGPWATFATSTLRSRAPS
jgi:hypothetical protein